MAFPRANLAGMRVGGFVCIEPTARYNRDCGHVVWVLRCPGCGAEKRWCSGMIASARKKQVQPRCACPRKKAA